MNVLSPMLNEKREIKAMEYFIICNALNVPLTKFADKEAVQGERWGQVKMEKESAFSQREREVQR